MEGRGYDNRRNQCEICDSVADVSCAFCGEVSYCSKEHKQRHWGRHSLDCKSYRVEESPEAGKFLVASRNIAAGSLILKDEPLVLGPLGTSDLICLSCHAPVNADNFYKCPDCKWPMCSLECALEKRHNDECEVLSKDKKLCGVPSSQGVTPRYDLILMLRCLLLKQSNPKIWELLKSMANHSSQKTEEKDPYQTATVRYFKEICEVEDDSSTLNLIRSVIITNAVQIRGPKGDWLRGVYPTVRLFNHSCIPNVHLSSNMEGVMEVRAAVDIKRGDGLCISYTSTDAPLWERQACLLQNHYFRCGCDRCQDPTELGILYSSVHCAFCNFEFMKPCSSDSSQWICNKCERTCGLDEIVQEINEWEFRLEMNELFGSGTVNKISYALVQLEQHFHIKHYLWLKAAKLALHKMRFSHTFEALKLKKYIWENILEIYNVTEPGINTKRGMTILELARVILELTKQEFLEQGDTSEVMIVNYMKEAKDYLQICFSILKNEPKGTPEFWKSASLPSKINEIESRIEKYNSSEKK